MVKSKRLKKAQHSHKDRTFSQRKTTSIQHEKKRTKFSSIEGSKDLKKHRQNNVAYLSYTGIPFTTINKFYSICSSVEVLGEVEKHWLFFDSGGDNNNVPHIPGIWGTLFDTWQWFWVLIGQYSIVSGCRLGNCCQVSWNIRPTRIQIYQLSTSNCNDHSKFSGCK